MAKMTISITLDNKNDESIAREVLQLVCGKANFSASGEDTPTKEAAKSSTTAKSAKKVDTSEPRDIPVASSDKAELKNQIRELLAEVNVGPNKKIIKAWLKEKGAASASRLSAKLHPELFAFLILFLSADESEHPTVEQAIAHASGEVEEEDDDSEDDSDEEDDDSEDDSDEEEEDDDDEDDDDDDDDELDFDDDEDDDDDDEDPVTMADLKKAAKAATTKQKKAVKLWLSKNDYDRITDAEESDYPAILKALTK